jgi:hypothetical protein
MLHGGAEQRLDVEHFSDSSDSLSRMHVLLRSTAVAGSSTSASVEQAFSKVRSYAAPQPEDTRCTASVGDAARG